MGRIPLTALPDSGVWAGALRKARRLGARHYYGERAARHHDQQVVRVGGWTLADADGDLVAVHDDGRRVVLAAGG